MNFYRDWLIHPWLSRERRDIFDKTSLLSHFVHFEKIQNESRGKT